MKILLINGSPNEKGCTYTALSQAEEVLIAEGFETEIFHVGKAPVSGCIACGGCRKTGKCVINDTVNTAIDKAREADGFILGSPVHYAAISGHAASFFDRLFFTGKDKFVGKPCGVLVSARRAGTTAALDQLLKYPTISAMPVASSTYWNMVHGNNPAEVQQDLEGLQTVRNMARMLAWMTKVLASGTKPDLESGSRTNFIR